jgi:hypothetical protein
MRRAASARSLPPLCAALTAAAGLAGLAALAALAGGLSGCGGDSGELAPIRLKHSPPVGRLDPQELRSLSMECEKYPPNNSMRGRYDAVYCEQAIAAWGDSPLQMVIIPPSKTP